MKQTDATMAEPQQEIEPISGPEARKRLEAAIRERLGDNWDDEDTGWAVVSRHDYMARLTRGRINLDFYVDLLGSVTVEQKELNPAQDSGRMIAWMFLLLAIAIAVLLARAVGWL